MSILHNNDRIPLSIYSSIPPHWLTVMGYGSELIHLLDSIINCGQAADFCSDRKRKLILPAPFHCHSCGTLLSSAGGEAVRGWNGQAGGAEPSGGCGR